MAKAAKVYVYPNKYPVRKIQQDPAIGRRLQGLRLASYNRAKKRFYYQAELAKLFGLSQSSIKNYENNLRRTPHKVLRKYADYFNVSIDWILTGV